MVSSIYTAQNNGVMSDIWKFASNFYVAVAAAIYLNLFYVLINRYLLDQGLDFLELNLISDDGYNFILNLILYFVIPVMILNYFAIYQESKYQELIKKYGSSYNKKIFAVYFLMSFLLMFIFIFSTVELRYK